MGAYSQFATFRLAHISAKQRESPHLSGFGCEGAVFGLALGSGSRTELGLNVHAGLRTPRLGFVLRSHNSDMPGEVGFVLKGLRKG